MSSKQVKTHPFLNQRGVKCAWLVCRLDDYSLETGYRGGFMPDSRESRRGGLLWPTEQAAAEAAKYMVSQYPSHTYGVFRLSGIVESAEMPVKFTRVRAK